MKNLEDKVVLVTGGASGLGRAIVERFVEEGAQVCLADVNLELGAAFAQAVGCHFVHTDVANAASVEAAVDYAVKRCGRLDVIVNCAGIQPEHVPLHETSLENFDRMIAVNLNGVMYGMKYALAQFMKQGEGGNVVNISSVGGMVALANTGAYAAAKGGVASLSRLGAIEYGAFGIRVNTVAPTALLTPLTQHYIDNSPDPIAAKQEIETFNPLAGMALPEDVAAAVAFLASDDARFISGIILPVDGGYTAR